MKVRPAVDPDRPGQRLQVRMPHNIHAGYLPAEGRDVDIGDMYWAQRVAHGDVEIMENGE